MPQNLAHSRSPANSSLARIVFWSEPACPANDNGEPAVSDVLVHAALRHFAEHGLGAARCARLRAEAAFFAGDRAAYDWWLGICRALDRRIAAQFDREFSFSADR